MDTYNKLSKPPKWALRTIGGGRLRGMTDVSPQWRIQAMTEAFGVCGRGWKWELGRTWTEPAPDGQMFQFVEVFVYIKDNDNDEWSAAIPGSGGNMLIVKEKNGLHPNDEAIKMATTDALGNALKFLGVAADIYAGHWDGSKYRNVAPAPTDNVATAQLDQLKLAWAKEYADDLQGLDKPALRNAFKGWVKLTLGDAYKLGGEWDVADATQWSVDDMANCLTNVTREHAGPY